MGSTTGAVGLKKIDKKIEKTFGSLPEKLLQFGEGNFLRAFLGRITQSADLSGAFGGSIVIVPPRKWDNCEKLMRQSCMYTVLKRGIEDGKTVDEPLAVTCVSRCICPETQWEQLVSVACSEDLSVIVSNTTEAGIVYCEGVNLDDIKTAVYPARLAALLHERYLVFFGRECPALLILPAELLERNGDELRACVVRFAQDFGFEQGFFDWLGENCCFANTLVDSIVSGFPDSEYLSITQRLGYEDEMLTACEPFLFWAIECDSRFIPCFPVDNLGLNIVFTSSIEQYRKRKVRILNGGHTGSVLAAFLCGHNTVGEMMGDSLFRRFLDKLVFEEIIPAAAMPCDELEQYAHNVFERFENPFIEHRLLSISLNSVSKYVKRCKGSLLDRIALGCPCDGALTFALAALICFYKCSYDGEKYVAYANGKLYEVLDSAENCLTMCRAWQSSDNPAASLLSDASLWGEDLTVYNGLSEAVSLYIYNILNFGMRAAVEMLLSKEGAEK